MSNLFVSTTFFLRAMLGLMDNARVLRVFKLIKKTDGHFGSMQPALDIPQVFDFAIPYLSVFLTIRRIGRPQTETSSS